MVFDLISKKWKYILVILVVTLVLIGKSDSEPYHKASTWTATDPSFLMRYSTDEDGVLIQSEQMVLNGITYYVDVCFSRNTYCVYPEGETKYSERLFSGTWEYRNNNLILVIEEDFIFEGKYNEILFVPD